MNAITLPVKKNSESIQSQAWVVSSVRQKTGSGLCYFRYRLFIRGNEFDAFLWFAGNENCWPEKTGTQINFSGEWTGKPSASSIRIKEINQDNGVLSMGVVLNLYQSPCKEAVDQLIQFISGLQSPLRNFLCDVFSDAAIATAFVKLPASMDHHHAYSGGLLEHSMECALMAGQLALPWLSQTEAEVTMVAALLHDIGKVRTHQLDNGFTETGYYVQHEAMTLEILAPVLDSFQRELPSAANLLRHILTWDHSKGGNPAFPGTLMVKTADRLSTGLNRRTQAFSDHPNWHYQARNGQFNKEKYLRIPE